MWETIETFIFKSYVTIDFKDNGEKYRINSAENR